MQNGADVIYAVVHTCMKMYVVEVMHRLLEGKGFEHIKHLYRSVSESLSCVHDMYYMC